MGYNILKTLCNILVIKMRNDQGNSRQCTGAINYKFGL